MTERKRNQLDKNEWRTEMQKMKTLRREAEQMEKTGGGIGFPECRGL